jgi:hypothetical protein
MQSSKLRLSLKISLPTAPLNPKEDFQIETYDKKKECNYITDGLYISSYHSSLDFDYLQFNGFTHIVNCAGSSSRFTSVVHEGFKYLVLNLEDDPNADLGDAVKKLLNFLNQAENDGPNKKVLIHCAEGVSRAPALVTSYLMWKYHFEPSFAVDFIKVKRPCIEINLGFMCQLEKLRCDLVNSKMLLSSF